MIGCFGLDRVFDSANGGALAEVYEGRSDSIRNPALGGLRDTERPGPIELTSCHSRQQTVERARFSKGILGDDAFQESSAFPTLLLEVHRIRRASVGLWNQGYPSGDPLRRIIIDVA
jgi:hypothetical protein